MHIWTTPKVTCMSLIYKKMYRSVKVATEIASDAEVNNMSTAAATQLKLSEGCRGKELEISVFVICIIYVGAS